MDLYNKSLAYFSAHPILNSCAHSAGGFGLAIILQYYIKHDVFVSQWVGWILIAFSVIIHIRSIMK